MTHVLDNSWSSYLNMFSIFSEPKTLMKQRISKQKQQNIKVIAIGQAFVGKSSLGCAMCDIPHYSNNRIHQRIW